VATAVTSTARSATLFSLGAGAAIGFAFSLIMGLS
jgi:xanthosine utilization system XapX-like protein